MSLVAETSDSGKSPLVTPAPRRFAPQPISMDVQPPPKAVLGKENVKESENATNAGEILGILHGKSSRSLHGAHIAEYLLIQAIYTQIGQFPWLSLLEEKLKQPE